MLYPTERLLRIEEVAEILSLSKSYAYQLARTGVLKCVRFGSAIRVRPADLEKFIKPDSDGSDPWPFKQ